HTSFSRDWSSDVCSSDLRGTAIHGADGRLFHFLQHGRRRVLEVERGGGHAAARADGKATALRLRAQIKTGTEGTACTREDHTTQIGRAACSEREDTVEVA